GSSGQRGVALLGSVKAGEYWDPDSLGQSLGACLVSQEAHRGGLRSNPHQAMTLAVFGEVGVLRQEAITGVDRLGARGLSGAQDRRTAEVALRSLGRSYPKCPIREADVWRPGVGIGVDRDGAQPRRTAGPNN